MPSQALPFDRAACLAKEVCLASARDAADMLFAARLYGHIADISIKVCAQSFLFLFKNP